MSNLKEKIIDRIVFYENLNLITFRHFELLKTHTLLDECDLDYILERTGTEQLWSIIDTLSTIHWDKDVFVIPYHTEPFIERNPSSVVRFHEFRFEKLMGINKWRLIKG